MIHLIAFSHTKRLCFKSEIGVLCALFVLMVNNDDVTRYLHHFSIFSMFNFREVYLRCEVLQCTGELRQFLPEKDFKSLLC